MNYSPPSRCSVCGEPLNVTRLSCSKCGSEITGSFQPCRYCALSEKHKLFLETFLRCRGSIKEVENSLSISYPTVKGLLDELLAALFPEENPETGREKPARDVLDQLERGEITAAQAAELLRKARR